MHNKREWWHIIYLTKKWRMCIWCMVQLVAMLQRLYRDRFPNRFVPGARMFMAIDRRLREHECYWRGRPGILRWSESCKYQSCSSWLGNTESRGCMACPQCQQFASVSFSDCSGSASCWLQPTTRPCTLVPVAGRAWWRFPQTCFVH